MGLGQVEDLLHRLAEAAAEQPARAERDLALHRLEARVAACAHGSRNVVSRSRRYGSLEREQRDEQRERRRRRSPRKRIGMPAATSSARDREAR